MKLLGILVTNKGHVRFFENMNNDMLKTTATLEKARTFIGNHEASLVIDTLRHKYPENTYYVVILGA
jgi:hypothetical protein